HGAARADVAVADRGDEIVDRVEAKVLRQLEDLVVLEGAPRDLAETAEFLLQRLAALLHVFLAAFTLEPLADLLARARRLHEVEPVARRTVWRLGREHLDDVAVLQAMVERDHPAVDLGADAAMADVGVNPVREVDSRRALWQRAHVTTRREDEDL